MSIFISSWATGSDRTTVKCCLFFCFCFFLIIIFMQNAYSIPCNKWLVTGQIYLCFSYWDSCVTLQLRERGAGTGSLFYHLFCNTSKSSVLDFKVFNMLSVKTYYVFFVVVVVFLYATKEASHPALDLVQELIQLGSVSAGEVLVWMLCRFLEMNWAVPFSPPRFCITIV